ncbi:MobF family relaxase [Microbacterium lacticum]
MVMTIRVMSSGRGYEYLLSSVAAGDGDRDMGTPLTRYYTETGCPPGIWLGSGLASLDDGTGTGLADGETVTEEQLARLLGDGLHPVTGKRLGHPFPKLQPPRERIATRVAELDPDLPKPQRDAAIEQIREEELAKKSRNAVAGFDLTFSPPKSLSMIWGIADAGMQALIAQAHHAAMHDTIALLEERVAATRVGRGGIARMPIRGVIAAAFDHYDSRAADPQLHTHIVVSNKVQGIDGRWRTLDSRRLHKATVALSASYNAFLTDHTARLLGVAWVPVDRGKDRNVGWEIDGVPTELIAEFSRRTTGGGDGEGIEAVKNRLIAEYAATHGRQPSAATIARLRQQATLETRPEKTLHSLAELTAQWRARATSLLGEDATTWAQHLLAREASEGRLRADDIRLDQVTDLATVVLMEVSNRRSVWNRWNLHAEAMRQLMGARFVAAADRTLVLDQILTLAEIESVRLTPAYDRPLPAHFVDADGNRFQSIDQIAYSSRDILDAEHRLLTLGRDTTGPTLTARLVARHVARKIKGVRLDADQVAVISNLARSGRVLDVLVGPAGAGKTTALRALHRAWTAAHGRRSVIGLAPSAAAADVLGDSLGIPAENTAKFLFEHEQGRLTLQPGQLVLLDEASLAGTLALDRIAELVANAGAKLVLVGDWAQLSSVETGGAFGMLVRDRGTAPTLTSVRRFIHDWEQQASLGLRRGDPSVLAEYDEQRRIQDGCLDDMLDAVYTAWQRDRDAGLATLMLASNSEMVAELNTRARADLIAAEKVEAEGTRLHDGTFAGVGDLVVTRRNDRRLTTGRAWVKNGDRWHVVHRYDDGSLAVRRLGRGDAPRGTTLLLPAAYVLEDLELGYASTTHRAQGASVDTGHALIDPDSASRELFYVAMTRGKERNRAYVVQPDPHELEAHLEPPEEKSGTQQLARVLARSDADLSATETIVVETEKHASLSTLLDEYDVLIRDAQAARWQAYLEVAPFPEGVADEIFTSPFYDQLESALARHENAGHTATVALNVLAPLLTPDLEQVDPAVKLATMLDEASRQLPKRPSSCELVAGLIRKPIEPLAHDIGKALAERQRLIESAARQLVSAAQEVGAEWLRPFGQPPPDSTARAQWQTCAATVALYRYRYDVTGPSPVGAARDSASVDQFVEWRSARAALARARRLTQPTSRDGRWLGQTSPTRRAPVRRAAV